MKRAYNIAIFILCIASIVLALLDISGKFSTFSGVLFYIDSAIMIIFAVDYIVRFIQSTEKWAFFKSNIPDLIAIVPFSAIFKFFRFARLFRLAKLAKITKLVRFAAFFGKMNRFFNTNGFIYTVYALCALITVSSGIMTYAENMEFDDALWWSLVTVTTVGYGDISPQSGIGRIVAGVLMIFGVAFISMLTSTLTSYFSKSNQRVNIPGIELTEEQEKMVIEYAKSIKPDNDKFIPPEP